MEPRHSFGKRLHHELADIFGETGRAVDLIQPVPPLVPDIEQRVRDAEIQLIEFPVDEIGVGDKRVFQVGNLQCPVRRHLGELFLGYPQAFRDHVDRVRGLFVKLVDGFRIHDPLGKRLVDRFLKAVDFLLALAGGFEQLGGERGKFGRLIHRTEQVRAFLHQIAHDLRGILIGRADFSRHSQDFLLDLCLIAKVPRSVADHVVHAVELFRQLVHPDK